MIPAQVGATPLHSPGPRGVPVQTLTPLPPGVRA